MCEPTAYGIEKALWKALNSQETLAEMASRGRQLIETKLNWNIATTNLIEAYRDVTKL
jgi:glycosyltransferase involved in cell wall biosynthesis